MFLVIAPLMTGVIVRTYGWIVLLGSEGTANKVLVGLGLVDWPVQILQTERAALIAPSTSCCRTCVFPIFDAGRPGPEPGAGRQHAGRRTLAGVPEVTLPEPSRDPMGWRWCSP